MFVIQIPRGLKAWRHKQNRLCGEQYAAGYKKEMKGIIFHYGLFKIVWDWFVLLLVLYTAIEVPFVVAFILGDESREKLSSKIADFHFTIALVLISINLYVATSIFSVFIFMLHVCMIGAHVVAIYHIYSSCYHSYHFCRWRIESIYFY